MDWNDKVLNGRTRRIAGVFLAVVGMAGCGKNEPEKHATQTAAKVNGAEITVHQVNHLLRQAGDKAAAPTAPRQVLDTLIDQELLVQKARENHLDRDPDVLQTLENARRQILSQAYLQRMVLPHTPISDQDKKDFFQNSPDLFEKRRIYQFQVFSLELPKVDEALNAALDQAQSPEKVRELLKQKQIAFQEEATIRPAEQLPLEMLSTFAKAKVGDIVIVPQNGGKTLLMQVVNLAERPVGFEQARNQVEQFLVNQRNRQATETHLKQLRAATSIEYAGDFAKAPPAAAAPAPAEPAAAAPPPDAGKHLEKGLSGLK